MQELKWLRSHQGRFSLQVPTLSPDVASQAVARPPIRINKHNHLSSLYITSHVYDPTDFPLSSSFSSSSTADSLSLTPFTPSSVVSTSPHLLQLTNLLTLARAPEYADPGDPPVIVEMPPPSPRPRGGPPDQNPSPSPSALPQD